MSSIDWIVLFGTLLSIVGYGVYKTRASQDLEGYFKGDYSMRWWAVGLSVMATQASAVTFLSTPGQAFEDGMRFIQFYFGLPIAMVILSVTAVPIYYRLKVYTAYEYLESRFDLKTRSLGAVLFLIQRGLAAGITIYAPSIVLSTLMDWSLTITILVIGLLVVIYTMSGGTKAVSQTQQQQMAVMMGGMIMAIFVIFDLLPQEISFGQTVDLAGHLGKFNVVNFSFDPGDRYNFWSGITGGLFLALAYFGTDQSQVQRYLSARSITQSRLGLMMNALLKVPMQFIILFVGVLVFVFYQFHQPPLYFIAGNEQKIEQSEYAAEWQALEQQHAAVFDQKRQRIGDMVASIEQQDQAGIRQQQQAIDRLQEESSAIQQQARELIGQALPNAETRDTDYVFLTFVVNYFPKGLVGLLLAVVFSAAMSSTASELNALASTTTIDIYKRSVYSSGSNQHYLLASKLFTFLWGGLAMLFAVFASLADNLIEFVNIVGSIFYGTILGIFLVAFYIRYVQSNAVFVAALVAEGIVIYLFFTSSIGFLWFNVIGCVLVVFFSLLIQRFLVRK